MRPPVTPLALLVLVFGIAGPARSEVVHPHALPPGGSLESSPVLWDAGMSEVATEWAPRQSREEPQSVVYFLFDVSESVHTRDPSNSRFLANLPRFEETVGSWWNSQQYFRYPIQIFVGTIGIAGAEQPPVCGFYVPKDCPFCPRPQQQADATALEDNLKACLTRLRELAPEPYADIASSLKAAALNMHSTTPMFRGIMIFSDLDPPPDVPPAVPDLEGMCVGMRIDASATSRASRNPQDIDRRLLLRLDLLRWGAVDSEYWLASYTAAQLGGFFQRCGRGQVSHDALIQEGIDEADRWVGVASGALATERIEEASAAITAADDLLARLGGDTRQLASRIAGLREEIRVALAAEKEAEADALRQRAGAALAQGRIGNAAARLAEADSTLAAAANPMTENGTAVAGRIGTVRSAIRAAIAEREREADGLVDAAEQARVEVRLSEAGDRLDEAEAALSRGGGSRTRYGGSIATRIAEVRKAIRLDREKGAIERAARQTRMAETALTDRQFGEAADRLAAAGTALASVEGPLTPEGTVVATRIDEVRGAIVAAIAEAEDDADGLTRLASEALDDGRIEEAANGIAAAEAALSPVGSALTEHGRAIALRIATLADAIRVAIAEAEEEADELTRMAETALDDGRIEDAANAIDAAKTVLSPVGSALTADGRRIANRIETIRDSIEVKRFEGTVDDAVIEADLARKNSDYDSAINALTALESTARGAPDGQRAGMLRVLSIWRISSTVQALRECQARPGRDGCERR